MSPGTGTTRSKQRYEKTIEILAQSRLNILTLLLAGTARSKISLFASMRSLAPTFLKPPAHVAHWYILCDIVPYSSSMLRQFLAGNFEGASYTWALNTIGGQSINLDDAGVDSSQLFFVAPGDLFLDAEQFLLGLIVRTIDNLQGSDQVELEVRAGDSFGLYLPEPLPVKRKDGEFRTAAIELSSRGLDPTKSYTYEYTWTWMGNTETWTVTSPPTGQAITSVNKLGRTFKILNSETTPGGVSSRRKFQGKIVKYCRLCKKAGLCRG